MTADRLASHRAHPLRTFLIVWSGQLAPSAKHLLSPMAAGLLLVTGGLVFVLLIDLSTFAVAVVAASLVLGAVRVSRSHDTILIVALMLVISGIGLAAAAGLATGPQVSGGTIKHIQEAVHP